MSSGAYYYESLGNLVRLSGLGGVIIIPRVPHSPFSDRKPPLHRFFSIPSKNPETAIDCSTKRLQSADSCRFVGIWTGCFECTNGRQNESFEDMRIYGLRVW